MGLTDWQTLCKMKWLARAYLTHEDYYEKRIRWLCWGVVDEYPGECRKQFRDRLIRKSTRLAVSITADLNKLTADQQ